jgi:thymidylate synthase (FAD)
VKVTPIASTSLLIEGFNEEKRELNIDPIIERWMKVDADTDSPDALGEFAGRACYQSFDKPNPKTAENTSYLQHIIIQHHFSVLEHASVTFYVEGVSRALTHELIRHRHLSYSQLSQRFVDGGTMVEHPTLSQVGAHSSLLIEEAARHADAAYRSIVRDLESKGLSKKQVRETARMVLPNSTETKIVVTGNLRAWREFVQKRRSPAADVEIQELAREILRHLKELAPNSFQDME